MQKLFKFSNLSLLYPSLKKEPTHSKKKLQQVMVTTNDKPYIKCKMFQLVELCL